MHRKLGIDLFNYVWLIIEKPDRTIMENDTMLHAAHASRYHWEQIGAPVNIVRGEWQISRVYSILKRSEPAIYHGQRCLDMCQEHQINDFDLAYAYEALARAYSIAQQWTEVRKFLELATSAGGEIADAEDKEWFFKDLSTIIVPDSAED
jgi:hypothetical protein